MANVGSFKIEVDNLEKVLEEKAQAVNTVLNTIGLYAERYAKESLTNQGAVDTGRLRNSVSYAVDGDTVMVGTNVEYAPYIELGTYRMKARPYIRPAIEDHISEYEKILQTILKGS